MINTELQKIQLNLPEWVQNEVQQIVLCISIKYDYVYLRKYEKHLKIEVTFILYIYLLCS